MRRSIRFAATLGMFVAGSAAAGQAPTANLSPPAEKYAVAPGGVDMRSGRYVYSQTDVDIGGLALARTLAQPVVGHNNPFGNFSHVWDVLVSEKRINVQQSLFTHSPGHPDYQIEISFGGRSQAFRSEGPDGGFDQVSRSGFASLTFTGTKASPGALYTYRTGDGAEVVFRQIGSGDCSSVLRCAYASHIVEADGTRLDLDYDNPGANATRLRSVTSSRGYALLLEYSGALVVKACVLNLTVTVKPANNVCPSGVPTATYTYSGARLAGATDASGAAWGFTYAGANMSFLRPGETSPWLTNTVEERTNDDGLVEEIVTQQGFADQSSYTYAFAESPPVMGHAPQIAGGSFTDNLGHTTTLRYDFPTRPFSPSQGHGDVPADGQSPVVHQVTPGPVEVTDPLGRVTTTDYCDPWLMANAPSGWLHRCMVMPAAASTTDPEGIRTEMSWDMYARTLLQTRQIAKAGSTLDPIVRSATYACTPANFRFCSHPVTLTDARGNTADYAYSIDHGGLLSETGPAPSASAPRPQTRHEYAQRYAWIANGSGGWTQAAAPVWVRTATSLCRTGAATGNPASPCATAGDEVRTTYDYGPDSGPNNLLLRGQAVSATDGGVTTTLRTCYTYDAHGNRLSETRPNANLGSCPAALAGAAPFTNAMRYDAMGRVTGTISADPDGAGGYPFLAVRNSYDPAGRLTKVETGTLAAWQSEAVAPSAWPGFVIVRTLETLYDAMSRRTREFVREGGAAGTVRTLTEYSYDEVGRLKCTAVRMNPDTFGLPPADACTPRAAGTQGPDRITRNFYDAAGQRLQLREGVGTTVEAAEATWAYNLNGQVTAVIDGNGNRATLRYDGHGRQDRWTFPSPTRQTAFNDATPATALATAGSVNAGDYEGYEYDANGNRTNLRKRDTRNIAFAYDALGRVTSKTYPEGGATPVHYGYDLRNLQLWARFNGPTGDGVVNQYDGFGRRTVEWQVMGGVTRYIASQYDADSNRIRITHPDGTEFTAGYDGLDRPYSLWTGWGAILGWMPRFDHGAIGSIGRGNGANTGYSYDQIQRLALIGHYYVTSSNNALWSYGYNPASQLATIGRDNDAYAWTAHYAVSRNYTTDGLNRYDRVGPAGFEAQFLYDLNGNLTSDGTHTYVYDIENRLVGAPGNLTLAYDPLGRLFQTSGGTFPTTRYLYDGDALAVEYAGDGTMLRRHVHWTGADVPMVTFEGAGLTQPRYQHADHQGSIVALSDASGNPAAINRYDEYGIPAPTNAGRFQYTGQVWLSELGMYYYKARIYSPYLGRFLQTDPVGYDDQFNLYAYVGNDPVNHTDPTGKRCNAERTSCTSDNYNPDRARIDVRHTPSTDAAVAARAGSFQKPARSDMRSGVQTEPRGVLLRNPDGTTTMRSTTSSGRQTNTGDAARIVVPANALTVIHGHLREHGGGRTVVDTPSENRGWGDAASLGLRNPVPTYTIAGDRIGVHDAPDGQVRFEMTQGAMTEEEAQRIQANLNIQQRTLEENGRPR